MSRAASFYHVEMTFSPILARRPSLVDAVNILYTVYRKSCLFVEMNNRRSKIELKSVFRRLRNELVAPAVSLRLYPLGLIVMQTKRSPDNVGKEESTQDKRHEKKSLRKGQSVSPIHFSASILFYRVNNITFSSFNCLNWEQLALAGGACCRAG